MGLIPGFEHDLFISYAWADNHERLPGELRSRWVYTLKEALEGRLNDRLRPDPITIWIDAKDMEGNRPLDEILDGAVARSALFLLVLSPNYLKSKYCRDELAAFQRKASETSGAHGRVFMVVREPTAISDRPDLIRDLVGYAFSREHPVTKDLEVFGDPLPAAKLPVEYSEAVQDLVEAMEKQLKRMRSVSATGMPPAAKGTVFLAPCTPDLTQSQKQLRAHLESEGYRVVPDDRERLSHAPAGYEAKFRDALSAASLFVQVLGPFHEPPLEGVFPAGFEQWQYQQARAAGLAILQWRRRNLTTADLADDSDHRDFVFAPTVVSCDLEEFKAIMLDQVKAEINKRARPAGDPRVLLLHSANVDEDLAQDIGQEVEDLCAEFDMGTVLADVIPEGLSLEDVTASNPNFHGLVVVYGAAEQKWVEQQADTVRRLALKYSRQKPVCGLVIGPPDPKPTMRLPARVERISRSDRERLREFLSRLSGRTS